MPEAPDLPLVLTVAGRDCWPAAAAALASLSGQLEEAVSEADLLDALAHGESLAFAGVLTKAQVKAEACAIIGDVLAWGDRQTGGEPCSAG